MKVTGHTDYVGSAAYNDKLAMKRAEAVKAFLVKYGVADDQVTYGGRRQTRPGSGQQDQGRPVHEPPRRPDPDRRQRQAD